MLSNQPDIFDPEYAPREPEADPFDGRTPMAAIDRPYLNREQRRTFGWASGSKTPQRKLQTRRYEGNDAEGNPIGSRLTRPSLAKRRRANRVRNRRAGAARRIGRVS